MKTNNLTQWMQRDLHFECHIPNDRKHVFLLFDMVDVVIYSDLSIPVQNHQYSESRTCFTFNFFEQSYLTSY